MWSGADLGWNSLVSDSAEHPGEGMVIGPYRIIREGLLTREQAECAAEQWIDNAGGLAAMVDAGLFDQTYGFVDVRASELSPALRSAAASATRTCASS